MNTENLQELIGKVELGPRGMRYLTEIVSKTEDAHRQGGLLKTQFNDIKQRTNRMFEDVWSAQIKNEYFKNREPKGMDDIYWFPYPEAHTIKNFKKRLAKIAKEGSPEAKAVIEKANALIDDLIPFSENVNSLKDMIKTQAELKERDPKRKDEFRAPTASKATRDRLKEALNDALEPLKEEIKEDFKIMMLRQVDNYYSKVSSDRPRRRNSPYYILANDPFSRQNVDYLLDVYKGDPETGVYGKRDDFDQRLNSRADDYASQVRDSFVAKQLQKIPGLIDSFGAIDSMSVNIWNKRAGNGAIEGSIDVKMKNNVSFVARTQVVYSTSSTGKFFPRYPTTFHNVHDTNGRLTAKRLSEKEMYSLNDQSPSP